MIIDLNTIKQLKDLTMYISKHDMEIYNCINKPSNCKATFNLNQYSEITFDINDIDDQNVFDDLDTNSRIYIDGLGWWVAASPSYSSEEGVRKKSCKLYSIEYDLSTRNLNNFYINTGEYGSINEVRFYDETTPSKSLMHLILDKFPEWSIGTIHEELVNKERTFSVESAPVYNFLTEEVAKTLQCIFVFDTEHLTISAYPISKFGSYTDVCISDETVVKSLSKSPLDESGITTAIRVYGNDSLDIRAVNCGFEYLYDLSYYYDRMSPELYQAWTGYNTLLSNHAETFRDAQLAYNKLENEMAAMKDKQPDNAESQTWSDYGIDALDTLLTSVNNTIENYREQGYDKESSIYYYQYVRLVYKYQYIYEELDKQHVAYNQKQAELDELHSQIETIKSEVAWSNHFTGEQLNELSLYIKEGDYTDNTFAITDIYTEEQIQQKQYDLMESAREALSALAQPQYSIHTDIVNISKLDAFQSKLDFCKLGNFIIVYLNDFYCLDERIVSFEVNFDDNTDIALSFSNSTRSVSGMSDLDYLLDNMTGVSSKSYSNSVSGGSGTGSSGSGDYVTKNELSLALNNLSVSTSAIFSPEQINTLEKMLGGEFDAINANYIYTRLLEADKAQFEELASHIITADYIESHDIVSYSASFHELNSMVTNTNTLIFGSAAGNVIQTAFSNSVIAQLGDAQIKSAMIEEINAEKIKSGNIYTNLVHIYGDDSDKLSIVDNTISISDGTHTRVQIGKDALGDYNMYVWDTAGNLMFDALGLTEDGITRPIIRDDVVQDNANISASKINIESLFNVINNDNSHTLKSSKIYVDADEQTLDVSFKNMTANVNTALSNADTANSTANNALSSADEANSKIDNLEIGGRNLALGTEYWSDGWLEKSNVEIDGNIAIVPLMDIPKYAPVKVLQGEQLTIGIDICSETTYEHNNQYGPLLLDWLDGNNDRVSYTWEFQNVEITDTWKRFTVSVNVPENAEKLSIGLRSTAGYVNQFRFLKIEKGNKATDWTPAPEDTASQINAITETVTSQGTELNVVQGQISSKIWQQDITTEVNNIEIGGRNLFILHTSSNAYINVEGQLVANSNYIVSDYIEIDSSKEYTFSRKPSDLTDTITDAWRYAWYDENKNFIGRTADGDNYVITTGFPENAKYIRVSAMKDTDIKVEKGNKTTDWTPAPEDTESKITLLNTQYSTMEQNLDGFKSEVGKTYATQSSVNTSLTEMNSAIEQSAKAITNTVSETYTTKTEFNNLEIGGRNLLRYTKQMAGDVNYVSATSIVTIETGEGEDDYAIATIPTGGNYPCVNFYLPDYKIEELEGKKVAISLMARSDCLGSNPRNFQICFGLFNSHNARRRYGGSKHMSALNVEDFEDEKWCKVKFVTTFPTISSMTVANSTEDYIKFGIQIILNSNVNTEYPIDIKQCKAEFGDVVSDYSVAQEDIKSETIIATQSSIEQLANSITLETSTIDKVANVVLSVNGEEQTGTIDMTGLVTFENLSDSGSTVINGDNITTGIIKSSNYKEAVGTLNPITGCKLNLNDGTFTSQNLKWDDEGIVTCNKLNATNGEFTGKVTATSGEIGGWKIGTNAIISKNETVELNSILNAIKFYSSTGKMLAKLDNIGIRIYGTNEIVRTLLDDTSVRIYNSDGKQQLKLHEDGISVFDVDGSALGHYDAGKLYTSQEGDELLGQIMRVAIDERCLGWAIAKRMNETDNRYTTRLGYERAEDLFYVNCDAKFVRHTETDPYRTKKIVFNDSDNTFSVTVGCGIFEDTSYDITNEYQYTEDSNGNITQIYNKTIERRLEIEYN